MATSNKQSVFTTRDIIIIIIIIITITITIIIIIIIIKITIIIVIIIIIIIIIIKITIIIIIWRLPLKHNQSLHHPLWFLYSSDGLTIWCHHLSRTEEPAKVGTCVRDRRALQQLALNVHVKHFDLDHWCQLIPSAKFFLKDHIIARYPHSFLHLCFNPIWNWQYLFIKII